MGVGLMWGFLPRACSYHMPDGVESGSFSASAMAAAQEVMAAQFRKSPTGALMPWTSSFSAGLNLSESGSIRSGFEPSRRIFHVAEPAVPGPAVLSGSSTITDFARHQSHVGTSPPSPRNPCKSKLLVERLEGGQHRASRDVRFLDISGCVARRMPTVGKGAISLDEPHASRAPQHPIDRGR